MKQFAYIIMGSIYNPHVHRAEFTAGETKHLIRTVRDFEKAKKLILELADTGVEAIELCGAFGKEKALEIMKLTDEKISISYSIHEPEMEELNTKFFNL